MLVELLQYYVSLKITHSLHIEAIRAHGKKRGFCCAYAACGGLA
jgi:hypothetical protein